MKIALITNFWLNSEGGGVRTYLKNLVQTLKERMIPGESTLNPR